MVPAAVEPAEPAQAEREVRELSLLLKVMKKPMRPAGLQSPERAQPVPETAVAAGMREVPASCWYVSPTLHLEKVRVFYTDEGKGNELVR
jgi:hypothetical protein